MLYTGEILRAGLSTAWDTNSSHIITHIRLSLIYGDIPMPEGVMSVQFKMGTNVNLEIKAGSTVCGLQNWLKKVRKTSAIQLKSKTMVSLSQNVNLLQDYLMDYIKLHEVMWIVQNKHTYISLIYYTES